eukprot:GEZU01002545.1.p1 GENE.GEZU01002545.1~~GEZU01002545.1.p1  ORF type:complete len:259 (-),score=62.81 GEZU01002545.1:42-752(-)
MVWLEVTHSILPIRSEKMFDSGMTIGKLKEKLYTVTGTQPDAMRLQLYDDNTLLADLSDENRTLESYNVIDRMRVHVIDTDPHSKVNELNDLSRVEKYEISEEAYDARDDTFRKWKQAHIKGESLEEKQEKERAKAAQEAQEEELAKNIKVGNRCEVELEGLGKMRGEVMFVGKVDFSTGHWVGVKLDEPLGKNDGSVKGKRYFSCPPNYGKFFKPSQVTVGDFPEQLDFLDDDEL